MLQRSCFRTYIIRQFSRSSVCLETPAPINSNSKAELEKVESEKLSQPLWVEHRATKKYVELVKKGEARRRYADDREKWIFTLQKFGQIVLYKNAFNEWWRERTLQKIRISQQFIQKRVDMLGYDLAAATFILARGGSIRFEGDDWIGRKGRTDFRLPLRYEDGYYVEAIDADGMDLHYDGIDCIRGLSVKVTNELKMSCIMLQDLLPLLEVIGIDFPFKVAYIKDTDKIGDGKDSISCAVMG
ncbi:UNVERIFIED_CONTAM: hypothetical protein PYX00_003339 [Menopon gallinae]|uniref:Uncharacterized protein n=1 Tax=Menopon gallinae TaxID=328185 RepID=A0AAW2HZH7_9NEOP